MMANQAAAMQHAVTTELTDWLLQSTVPTIRFQTRTDLLGQSVAEAADDRVAIMHEGPIPALLAEQAADGTWIHRDSYYSPKYKSTHWTMLLLAELAIDGQHPQFQRGLDYMLAATSAELEKRVASGHVGLSCFWGNLLRYTLHGGRSDTQVEQLIANAVWELQRGPCQCRINSYHACAWGAVRSLWGLAAIPPSQRSAAVNRAIAQGIAFLLESYRLVDANYPTPDDGKVHTLWFKLNFPLFYQVDILFTLRVLAVLDALDHPGAQPALAWLATQQQKHGRWRGASPYRSRTWSVLGNSAESSRWVSLFAAQILQQAGMESE